MGGMGILGGVIGMVDQLGHLCWGIGSQIRVVDGGRMRRMVGGRRSYRRGEDRERGLDYEWE